MEKTVKDLIKDLLDYNLDAEVVTSYTETVELGYIDSKEETPFVFIDGCDYVREEDEDA